MLNNVKTVLKENYDNRYRLIRLANYELKAQNNGTMFGFLWNFFNPILQILVYWFVFAIGLKSAAPQGKYPYIIWMIVGIMPWFYMSTALTTTGNSIYAYSGVLKRMYIPLSIVPIKSVLSALIAHFWSMLVVIGIIFASGYSISLYYFQTLYFTFASFILLCAYALFASAVVVVFRDFQKIMLSVIRLLFYITPIVWVQDNLPAELKFILKLNPFAYLIDGYRDSILYERNLMFHWKQGVFFWAFTIIFFIIGCNIHMKFRKQFIDLI
ncbi:MAG: ABC transporter permease [Clostridia bacterium]|nr:ABC transporter permease [Clostridia bacterium]MCI2015035.1 ABC transporter permease [Clostridia bacterium]